MWRRNPRQRNIRSGRYRTAVHLEVKSSAEHARGYRRMGLVIEIVQRHFDAALAKGDLAAADNVLLGAGRDALGESRIYGY